MKVGKSGQADGLEAFSDLFKHHDAGWDKVHAALVSPVVGSEPVQWCVQLDDVGAKENIVSNLIEMKA